MLRAMDALTKAIEQAGGVARLASRIGVAPNVVGNWKLRESVPADRCLAIEQATEGVVTRHDLRPDVFGPAPNQEARDAA